jgi:hypothetical protein
VLSAEWVTHRIDSLSPALESRQGFGMDPRQEIQEFLLSSKAIIPMLSMGEALTDTETSILGATIERLRSSYLTWESIQREKRRS